MAERSTTVMAVLATGKVMTPRLISIQREASPAPAAPTPDVVRILVGHEQRAFHLPRKPLLAASSFFHDLLATTPGGLPPSAINGSQATARPARYLHHQRASSSPAVNGNGTPSAATSTAMATIRLPGESADMFDLFARWILCRRAFRRHIDWLIQATSSGGCSAPTSPPPSSLSSSSSSSSMRSAAASPTSPLPPTSGRPLSASALHWALVHLHLFAARLNHMPPPPSPQPLSSNVASYPTSTSSTSTMAALQDTALDALQDLYLARDWDASPGLVRFLYSHDGRGAGMDAASAEMHAEHAFRLRRWAVAMVAWTLALAEQGLAHGRRIDEESCCGGVGGYREEEGDCHNGDSGRGKVPTLGTVREECSATDQHQLHRAASTASSCSVHDVFQRLFDEYPAFEGDYRRHVRKMSVLSGGSGNGNGTSGKGSHLGTVTGAGTIATKNPQLRLASNALRNGERSIGFRQCAFHGHRAEVGEGRCPNRVVVRSPWKMAAGSGSGGAFYDPFGSLGDGDEENDPGLAALLLSPEEDAFAFSVGSWKDDMGEGDVLGLGLGLGLGHGVSGNYGAGSFAMTDNSKLGHQSYSQQRLAPSTNRDVAPQKRTGLAVRSHIRSQSHY